MNKYTLKNAETINQDLMALPIGKRYEVFAKDQDGNVIATNQFVAIVVNGRIVYVPSSKYQMRQTFDTFRPMIEGLTIAGVRDFQYTLWHTDTYANLAIYLDDADDGEKGVRIGFRATNSFDGSSAINYGFRPQREWMRYRLLRKRESWFGDTGKPVTMV